LGGISTHRKINDGHWCPHCFAKNLFSWLNKGYGRCLECKESSHPEDSDVKQLMIGR
jgi:uncharacterized protein (DUF983 family)